jgi:hypothetical protein
MTQADQASLNAHPFARSFAVAGVLLVVLVALMFLVGGPPDTAEDFGAAVGRLLVPLSIAALVAGFVARSRDTAWAWWKYAAVVVPIGLVLSVILAVG